MSEIQPALTPEEWQGKNRLPGGEFITTDQVQRYTDGALTFEYEYDIKRPHATAALCLYGQPFGFTWEDVHRLETMAEAFETDPDPVMVKAAADFNSIADRIAALLNVGEL